MVKIILHAIGNDKNFNYYIFDKKQKVADVLSKIITGVFENYWDFIDGKIKKNIEKLKDTHESFGECEDSRVDVFYGNKKMFLTINCDEKLRIKFNEELFKIAKIPKYEHSKNIKWTIKTKNKKLILQHHRRTFKKPKK